MIRSDAMQVGISSTPGANLTIDVSAGDGSAKFYMGALGAPVKNLINFDTSGNVDFQQNVKIGGVPVGRMQFIATKATTSGTSILFSSADGTGIPSWAKRITLIFNGVSLNGSSHILVQGGSGSVQTTGYGSSSGVVSYATANSTAGTTSTAGFVVQMNTAAFLESGKVEVFQCGTGSFTYSSAHTLGGPSSDPKFGGGNVTLAGLMDRINITTVNGTDTFDAGSITLLCEG